MLVRRELPVLLDFLVMQVESGHSILQALHSAVALFSQRSPVRKGLEELAESIRVGCSVDEALGQLNLFLDTPESESPITAISLALKHGSPLGKVLRNQSARLRERLIIEGEKFASTLPVKMLVPLLFFMFPASFLVIFSPVLVSLLENLP
ncbi:MAG: type II secretion system F family protein [bacterium]|nr:MAG: type II secretion system F family protein [bacterium]